MPRLSLMYGCVKLRPKRIPTVSAIGGESNPVNESARARTKISFARVGIDWEKSIRRMALRASECPVILGVPPETGKLQVERGLTERAQLLVREELRAWTSRELDAQARPRF